MQTLRQAIKHRVRPHALPLVVPPLRAYLRRAPFDVGKRWLWTSVLRPYLANAHYDFVARTFFGAEVAGNTRDLIQRYIYYFGVWEPNLTRWIGRQLRPGDTFVDVGANIGYYSLYAAHLVGPAGAVVAIEASPAIFRILTDNLARNGARHVRAVNVAAAESPATVRLYRGPENNRGRTTTLAGGALEFECEIEARPLCELLTAREAATARIVKIDVEGAEWSVVQGLAPLLGALRPDVEIALEISPARLAEHHRSVDDVVSVFRDAGFHTYCVDNDYQARAYLPPRRLAAPVRLRGPLDRQVDVIFSRRDAERL